MHVSRSIIGNWNEARSKTAMSRQRRAWKEYGQTQRDDSKKRKGNSITIKDESCAWRVNRLKDNSIWRITNSHLCFEMKIMKLQSKRKEKHVRRTIYSKPNWSFQFFLARCERLDSQVEPTRISKTQSHEFPNARCCLCWMEQTNQMKSWFCEFFCWNNFSHSFFIFSLLFLES